MKTDLPVSVTDRPNQDGVSFSPRQSPQPQEREPNKRDPLALPAGFTCDSCFAFSYCVGFGVSQSGQTRCDWHPVRYQLDVSRLSASARQIVNSLVARGGQ
jgi:hypothetical protein